MAGAAEGELEVNEESLLMDVTDRAVTVVGAALVSGIVVGAELNFSDEALLTDGEAEGGLDVELATDGAVEGGGEVGAVDGEPNVTDEALDTDGEEEGGGLVVTGRVVDGELDATDGAAEVTGAEGAGVMEASVPTSTGINSARTPGTSPMSSSSPCPSCPLLPSPLSLWVRFDPPKGVT